MLIIERSFTLVFMVFMAISVFYGIKGASNRAAGDTAVAYATKDMHAAFPKDSNGEDIERFSIVEHVETVTCLRVNRKFLS